MNNNHPVLIGSQLVAPDHQVFSFQNQKDPHMINPET